LRIPQIANRPPRPVRPCVAAPLLVAVPPTRLSPFASARGVWPLP
jgi:hypothetical protein